MLDNDITDQINHLKTIYKWDSQKAMDYLLYAPYDPIDWVNTKWEYQPIRTN